MQNLKASQPNSPSLPTPTGLSKWQWQSDGQTWNDYGSKECLLLEEAFFLNHQTVSMPGIEHVDLEKMIQVNKGNNIGLPPILVRRLENRPTRSRFIMEIPEPVSVQFDQTRINEGFGTVRHFVEDLMKKIPEAYSFYQKLKKLTANNDVYFQDVVRQVISSIQKGAEQQERTSKGNNSILEGRWITGEIKNNSRNPEDFLKTILKIYTTNGFISKWVNSVLQKENLEELKVLAPFVISLAKVFTDPEFIMKYEKPIGMLNALKYSVSKQTLILYRGAAISKKHFELYSLGNLKYFTLKGVISTCRNKEQALKLADSSLKQAKEKNEEKVGVVFVIEVDFASAEDGEGMIDLENEFEEVLLAPGAFFGRGPVKEINNEELYEVSLRLFKRKADENPAFIKAVKEQCIVNNKGIAKDIHLWEGLQAMQCIKGDKSIKKLGVKSSVIKQEIMEILEDFRIATANLKKEDVYLSGNLIYVSSLSLLADNFSQENLNGILALNDIFTADNNTVKKDIVKLKHIELEEKTLASFQKEEEKTKIIWGLVKNENQITSFKVSLESTYRSEDCFEAINHLVSLENLDIKLNPKNHNENFMALFTAINSLKKLQSLKLKSLLSEKAVLALYKTFSFPITLQHLSLDLSRSSPISIESLVILRDSIKPINALSHLSLNLGYCSSISNKGLDILRAAFGGKHLRHLSLDLQSCEKLSDEGIGYLSSEMASIVSLQHLHLNLKSCSLISDHSLASLKNAIFLLKSLQTLSLDFEFCQKITDAGLNDLKNGLISLACLKDLSLGFALCNRVSDQGVANLKDGIASLQALENFTLNLSCCYNFKDTGFSHLKDAISPLKNLQSLAVDFRYCTNITDKGIVHLKETLFSLDSLQNLSLNFSRTSFVTSKGLNELETALLSLTNLQSLSLSFVACSGLITDAALDHLKETLLSLTSLKALALDFRSCDSISDKGLNSLKILLIYLQSLQSLSLEFGVGGNDASKISDEGINYLAEGLKCLTSLNNLLLSFEYYPLITNAGLNSLKSGLVSLECLKTLTLRFTGAKEISDEGVEYLKSGIISMISLQNLSLSLLECKKFSEEGREKLRNQLNEEMNLKNFALNFGQSEDF